MGLNMQNKDDNIHKSESLKWQTDINYCICNIYISVHKIVNKFVLKLPKLKNTEYCLRTY